MRTSPTRIAVLTGLIVIILLAFIVLSQINGFNVFSDGREREISTTTAVVPVEHKKGITDSERTQFTFDHESERKLVEAINGRRSRLEAFEKEVISVQKENRVFRILDKNSANTEKNLKRILEEAGIDLVEVYQMKDEELLEWARNSKKFQQQLVSWLNKLGEKAKYWDSIYSTESPGILLSPVFLYPMKGIAAANPNNNYSGRVRFISAEEYQDFSGLETAILYSTQSSFSHLIDWMLSRKDRAETKAIDVIVTSLFAQYSPWFSESLRKNTGSQKLKDFLHANNPAYRLVAYKSLPILVEDKDQLIDIYRRAGAEKDPIFWKEAIDGLRKLEDPNAKSLLKELSDKLRSSGFEDEL